MTSIVRSLLALIALAAPAVAQFGPPMQVNEIAMRGGICEPGDVDRDGMVDIVAGDSIGRIVWRAGVGGGQFGSPHLIDVRDRVAEIALADLDGDTDLDLVAIALPQDGEFVLLRYEFLGADGFGPAEVLDTALGGYRVELSDMDGDGDIDIVTNDDDRSEVFYYANVGGGQFATTRTFISAFEPSVSSVEAEDLDGDGDTDVICCTYAGFAYAFVVYENLGGGVFTRDVVLSIFWGNYREFAFGDLDGDGDIDLLGASGDDQFDWYEQTSPMTFVNRYQFVQPVPGSSCDIADVDGDGDLDLLTVGREIEWHENDGSVAFVTHTLGQALAGIGRGRFADVDGSGTLDVVWSTTYAGDEVSWFSNLGGGAFGAPTSLQRTELPKPGAIAAADFDLDGDIDIAAMSERTGSPGLWLQLGSGQFGPQALTPGQVVPDVRRTDLVARDFDLDGDVDLFVVSGSVRWMENRGVSPVEFEAQQPVFTGIRHNSLLVEDIDGDGWLDVAATNDNQGTLWTRRGTGPGALAINTLTLMSFSGIGTDLTAADFDGDGDLDVAITNETQQAILIAETLPNFTFGPPTQLLGGLTGAHSITAVDVDQDGAMDLVACGASRARWLPGVGDGTFLPDRPITGLASQGNRIRMEVADVDGDGRPDVLVAAGGDGSAPPNVAWTRNLGQGNWQAGGTFLGGETQIEYLLAVDVDGDLDLDLITAAPVGEQLMVRSNETGVGTSYCAPAALNSAGLRAAITGSGSNAIADDDLTLRAFDLPPNRAGYFLASRTQGFVAQPNGSQGNLCLSGSIGRYVQQVANSGAMGAFDVSIQPLAIEQPNGAEAALVGETWSFQCWFRDLAGGVSTSNFTSGYAVRFQ